MSRAHLKPIPLPSWQRTTVLLSARSLRKSKQRGDKREQQAKISACKMKQCVEGTEACGSSNRWAGGSRQLPRDWLACCSVIGRKERIHREGRDNRVYCRNTI